MSSYVKRAMQADEKVVYSAQLHWIIYRAGILFVLIGIGFSLGSNWLASFLFSENTAASLETPIRYVSIGLIVAGAFDLLSSFIQQISTELVITDRRVIAKHGFISTTSYEVMMSKIEGATIEQSILGRMLGYGTLMVKGTGGSISPIDHVDDPYRFHAYLMDALKHENDSAHHPSGEGR